MEIAMALTVFGVATSTWVDATCCIPDAKVTFTSAAAEKLADASPLRGAVRRRRPR